MKTQIHRVITPQSDHPRRTLHIKGFPALRWIFAGVAALFLWSSENAEAQALPSTPDNAATAEVVTVPEPGAIAMLLGGFGTLLGFQRLRRRR